MTDSGKMCRSERRFLERCRIPWVYATFLLGMGFGGQFEAIETAYGTNMSAMIFAVVVTSWIFYWPGVWMIAERKFPDGNEPEAKELEATE